MKNALLQWFNSNPIVGKDAQLNHRQL